MVYGLYFYGNLQLQNRIYYNADSHFFLSLFGRIQQVVA